MCTPPEFETMDKTIDNNRYGRMIGYTVTQKLTWRHAWRIERHIYRYSGGKFVRVKTEYGEWDYR